MPDARPSVGLAADRGWPWPSPIVRRTNPGKCWLWLGSGRCLSFAGPGKPVAESQALRRCIETIAATLLSEQIWPRTISSSPGSTPLPLAM